MANQKHRHSQSNALSLHIENHVFGVQNTGMSFTIQLWFQNTKTHSQHRVSTSENELFVCIRNFHHHPYRKNTYIR